MVRFQDQYAFLNSAVLPPLLGNNVVMIIKVEEERWDEAAFAHLAKNNPQRLLSLLDDQDLTISLRTFAAEAAGGIELSAAAVPSLLPLLEHPSAVVREGAVYGLANHLDYAGVREQLGLVASGDVSPGVRRAALDTLDD
jgi:HEAT repeat protein